MYKPWQICCFAVSIFWQEIEFIKFKSFEVWTYLYGSIFCDLEELWIVELWWTMNIVNPLRAWCLVLLVCIMLVPNKWSENVLCSDVSRQFLLTFSNTFSSFNRDEGYEYWDLSPEDHNAVKLETHLWYKIKKMPSASKVNSIKCI